MRAAVRRDREQPIPKGVPLPDGAVCRVKESSPQTVEFTYVYARPSPICLATFQQLGCRTLEQAELEILTKFAADGWEPRESLEPEWLQFQRDDAYVDVSLYRHDRFGEITANVKVTHVAKD